MAKRGKGRSQKKHHDVRVPVPVALIGVLVFVVIVGLSYMWICARCEHLGKEIKRREQVLAQARKRCKNERNRWAYLTSPSNLRKAIKRCGFEMSTPHENQIVRVEYRGYSSDEFLAVN